MPTKNIVEFTRYTVPIEITFKDGIECCEWCNRSTRYEYQQTFLQVPRIDDRKPVFVSSDVRDRLDRVVRILGGRRMSVSGIIENIVRHHLSLYEEDFEAWRKL